MTCPTDKSILIMVERESGAYAELGRIFGKTGIPAMIIDNALPELESSANAILHRMTDGAMQVQFMLHDIRPAGAVTA